MNVIDVAAYIWPSCHYEPRLEHFWPEKDGEWYIVRKATPRFEGHDQPRIPLLGYQDEADPAVMRQQVELAMAHGVNVFIVDWYWYENAPCLERQLNEGLIPAIEGTNAKFYLMWANHNMTDLWDMTVDTDWTKKQTIFWRGNVDRPTLEPMWDRLIENYFGHPNYYCIEDKPVFSIFQTRPFVNGLGGVEEAAEATEWMRQRCVEKDLPGLHLQTIGQLKKGVEGGEVLKNSEQSTVTRALKVDSTTLYNNMGDFGQSGDYVQWMNASASDWNLYKDIFGTFFPTVSVGWDNTLRNPGFERGHVVVNSTPDAFEAYLWKAKAYIEANDLPAQLITINAWNEWAEGSYLLPDMRWGYRYLQAVRNVFGSKSL